VEDGSGRVTNGGRGVTIGTLTWLVLPFSKSFFESGTEKKGGVQKESHWISMSAQLP